MDDGVFDPAALFASASPLELAAVVFSLLYLVLAIRESLLCWPAALIATTLSLIVLYRARLYPDAALQVFYAAMAVYGWLQWRRGGGTRLRSALPIGRWPLAHHALALAAVAVLGGALGWLLTKTDAAFPYLDSFLAVASIVTTYMVAKKILENWLYWLVIDGIGVYVYSARGLYFFTALFVLYEVLVVLGYLRWVREWRAQAAPSAAR